MELITRTEGQLSHHPELRPLVFDIPVIMLEYTLSFLNWCARILQRKDEVKRDIHFLLVPQLCQRIEAEELFHATDSMPGLVLVQIPYDELYDTFSIQASLCHEISHFVGEKCRNRRKRVEYFSKSAAILISKIIFRCYDQMLVNQISDELRVEILNNTSMMAVEMVAEAEKWILRLCEDEKTYDHFKDQVFLSGFSVGYLPSKMNMLTPYLDHYLQLVREVGVMFREVFADVCMLYMLKIDSHTYFSLFRKELNESDSHSRELFYLRIFVSLRACGKSMPNTEPLHALQREMDRMDGLESENRLIPLSIIRQLELYAKECYQSFGQPDCQELKELRKAFLNASSPDMDYGLFRKNIEDYRKLLLDKWNCK
ncbi:MAG: hypothetical protein IJU29_04855 [Oscillospiraceae bacterium]|nr:hypothetical protein [Oscillospiraceae bacterium]